MNIISYADNSKQQPNQRFSSSSWNNCYCIVLQHEIFQAFVLTMAKFCNFWFVLPCKMKNVFWFEQCVRWKRDSHSFCLSLSQCKYELGLFFRKLQFTVRCCSHFLVCDARVFSRRNYLRFFDGPTKTLQA